MKLFGRRRNEHATNRFAHLLEAGDLPTFPSVVAAALRKISAADVDLREVSGTIAADPKVSVNVLRLANSPAFSPRSPVTSLHQAVVMLGRNQVEALLIASGVGGMMPATPVQGYSPQQFWKGAAQRAAAASALAAIVRPGSQHDQFTAALLQDMAQPLLLQHDRPYVELVASSQGSHADLACRERDELGWTHGEIGELMCTHWGLPVALSTSVSVHHDHDLGADTYDVAQWAAHIEGEDTDIDLVIQDAMARFGVSSEIVQSVLDLSSDRAGGIAGAFV